MSTPSGVEITRVETSYKLHSDIDYVADYIMCEYIMKQY